MSRWIGRSAFAFAAVLLCIFAWVRWAQSCADPGDPFEDYSQHPDIPLERFARGELGIIQPTFAHSYLVVAYRYASAQPLTRDEQDAAMALWQFRLSDSSDIFYPKGDGATSTHPPNRYLQEAQDAADGPKDWLDERAKVIPSGAPKLDQFQATDNYSSYVNCSNDAFTTAAVTLKQRMEKFGADNPGVKEWVTAQDAVFANCGGAPDHPVLPAAASASLPEIFRHDREYQTAAAYMYSNHYDEAIQRYQSIAADKKSPWHDLALYLVARSMVRRATLEVLQGDNSVFEAGKMQAAVDFTSKTLRNTPNVAFKAQLEALLDRAEFQLHPDEQTVRLAARLSKPAPDGRFLNWLCDYTWLLNQRGDVRGEYGAGGNAEEYGKGTADRQKDGLTDWIATLQMESPEASQHALAIWRAHRDSMPWLVVALEKTEPNSPQVQEILAAADQVPSSSPVYVDVFYQRMRLRGAMGQSKEVRSTIDKYLGSSPDIPSVARDYLLDLRLDAASDLDDAVHFLPRTTYSVSNRTSLGTIAEHPARFLDGLPLDLIVNVLHNKNLPETEQAKFVRNVWLRAVILGRHDVSQPLDALAFRSGAYQTPVSNDIIQKLVKEYESASTPEEKQFAAIFLMQHEYAFGYEMGSGGAWCASPQGFPKDGSYLGGHPPASSAIVPAFLTEAQRKQVETEQSQLDKSDSQANYYVKIVVEYAENHGDDPRVPEALSRAVKNTRMNCNNSRTGNLSKHAFDLLHERYPQTSWAKSTKYWFGEQY